MHWGNRNVWEALLYMENKAGTVFILLWTNARHSFVSPNEPAGSFVFDIALKMLLNEDE